MSVKAIKNIIKQLVNKILFIPGSFFDVRSISILFVGIFISDFTYKMIFTKNTIFMSAISAMFYPIILGLTLFIYSKILSSLKKDLLIPRKWVNFGMTIVIIFIVGEKLVWDFLLKDTTQISLVIVAFVSIITFIFTNMMNMWLKISDKNLKALQDIVDKESLYRVLFDYTWQWLGWINNVNVEKENIRSFIKNFHIQEGASFFDNYLALTPYVAAYGSHSSIQEYNNIMLQIVEMNNIREEIISRGWANDKNLLKLRGRKGDCIVALEMLMMNMKSELIDGMTSEEQEEMLTLIRAREKMITLKDKVLF